MLATLKETVASLQDLNYGKTIISKTTGQALWYWTKYVILIAFIGLVLGLGLLSYYTPQLSRLAGKQLPDIDISITKGKLSTHASQPFIQGDKDFVFILNTKGSEKDLDAYKSGVILTEDKIISKDTFGKIQIQRLDSLDDIKLDKPTVVNWLSSNRPRIFGLGLVLLLVATFFITGFSWLLRLSSIASWSAILWLTAKIIKRPVNYSNSLKIALYASVLPLIISAISTFTPNTLTSWITLGIFLFYSFSWLSHLPVIKK